MFCEYCSSVPETDVLRKSKVRAPPAAASLQENGAGCQFLTFHCALKYPGTHSQLSDIGFIARVFGHQHSLNLFLVFTKN